MPVGEEINLGLRRQGPKYRRFPLLSGRLRRYRRLRRRRPKCRRFPLPFRRIRLHLGLSGPKAQSHHVRQRDQALDAQRTDNEVRRELGQLLRGSTYGKGARVGPKRLCLRSKAPLRPVAGVAGRPGRLLPALLLGPALRAPARLLPVPNARVRHEPASAHRTRLAPPLPASSSHETRIGSRGAGAQIRGWGTTSRSSAARTAPRRGTRSRSCGGVLPRVQQGRGPTCDLSSARPPVGCNRPAGPRIVRFHPWLESVRAAQG